MTPEQRQERDPAALQIELLEIDRQLEMALPRLLEVTQVHEESKAELTVLKTRIKILKERRSGLQSVLKSVSQF